MTALGPAEFDDHLRHFRHTAFRLELQPAYREPGEPEAVARFLADGQLDPAGVPGLTEWCAQIATHISAGKHVERVRVHEEPPTDYQRWERALGQRNIDAGETIRYLGRIRAHEIGLLPAAGDKDWWLLDSDRLIVMTFDAVGTRIRNELVTDPATVAQACAWRDLAVHYSAPG